MGLSLKNSWSNFSKKAAQQGVQWTWWWAVQKAESKRKPFSVSSVGSPTKPQTRAVRRLIDIWSDFI
jgi:hypothetical protein